MVPVYFALAFNTKYKYEIGRFSDSKTAHSVAQESRGYDASLIAKLGQRIRVAHIPTASIAVSYSIISEINTKLRLADRRVKGYRRSWRAWLGSVGVRDRLQHQFLTPFQPIRLCSPAQNKALGE